MRNIVLVLGTLVTACGMAPPAEMDAVAPVVSSGVDAGVAAADGGAPGDCPRTSMRVGWSTELTTRFHGVRGRVTMTDACTLTLTGFSYDGQGIDVRLTGAATGEGFADGVTLGPQLLRPSQPWVNETLVIPLPSNVTLDRLDAVSVWCVAASVDFGSGTFAP